MQIRSSRQTDLASIVAIRNHSIAHSNALFETSAETIEGRRAWFAKYAATGPHRIFVAEDAGVILGYTSSSRYREGEAFNQTVESSIFVAPVSVGRGVGFALYAHLFEVLKGEKVHTVVAGIALPNDASKALHLKCGFEPVGVFKEYAVKQGQYYSSLWLQKMMG